MTDIAGAVPAGIARTGLLRRPQPVVAVLDVSGRYADLSGDIDGMQRRAGSPTQGVERADPEANAGEDMADADPVAQASLLQLRQRDVGHRQDLGHPVRGVDLSCGKKSL